MKSSMTEKLERNENEPLSLAQWREWLYGPFKRHEEQEAANVQRLEELSGKISCVQKHVHELHSFIIGPDSESLEAKALGTSIIAPLVLTIRMEQRRTAKIIVGILVPTLVFLIGVVTWLIVRGIFGALWKALSHG